jgi:hypothetical protein
VAVAETAVSTHPQLPHSASRVSYSPSTSPCKRSSKTAKSVARRFAGTPELVIYIENYIKVEKNVEEKNVKKKSRKKS